MNFIENVREGMRSMKASMLRTTLTALIVAVGIASLVGMLTAIDGIHKSVEESFSTFGVNTFDIVSKRLDRSRNVGGVVEKRVPPLKIGDVRSFKNEFEYTERLTITTNIGGGVEVKYGSLKTNPNSSITGTDDNFISINGYDLVKGRNFTPSELSLGLNVAIIGDEIAKTLFLNNEDPINKRITFYGQKFTVIGVLDKQGGFGPSGGADRQVLIPYENAAKQDRTGSFSYALKISVTSPEMTEYAMGEATLLMRKIRRDQVGRPESFEVVKSESLSERLDEISGYLRIGGFGIGFITLLGASIGLMNIMMVTVTERTREIGIRKAMGATPEKIREQFLIEAIVICIAGGALGILLGILIGNGVSNIISPGSLVLPWFWMFFGIIVCIIVGLISGFIPANKASKLDPIESLRYE
jgi:putative ABC transport system permease protein